MVGQLKEFKAPNEREGETFPTFASAPAEFVGKEGDRAEFKCVIEGNPPPKIAWRKGQWLQIDDGGRYDVRKNNQTGVCTMAIKKCRYSDSGKYKVVIVNDFGEVTFSFSAKIEQERKKSVHDVKNFKQQLKHREVKQIKKKTAEEREKEVLEILKTADPKDYEKICIEYGFFDFRMILHKLQAFKKVDIPAPEPEAVKVLKALRHVTVNDEGTAVFEIHLENAQSSRNMMWYKDGEIVQVPGAEKRHELRCVGNVYQLIIRNVKAEDAGTYTLDIGGEKFDAVLTIKEQPLEFKTGLKTQTARVHGRCVFECVVTRRSQRVTWLKDGEEIRFRGSTGRVQAVSEAKIHRLLISEISLQDAGRYTAKLGDLESSAELSVTAAPVRFRQRLTNTEVKEKATATFECSVSNKEVKPIWTINGKEITNDARYTIKSGDVHKLTVKKVMLSDHKAEIKVSFGDVVSTAELQVNAKPIKVLTRMQDTKCKSGGTAEFSCEIDDVDADAQVQWFKNDQLIQPSKKYEMIKRKGKYFLKLNGVTEADEGIYQFQIRGVRSEAHLTCNDPPVVDKAFLEKLRKNPLKFKAGSTAKIVVPFTGKPASSVSWTNGRVTLTERGRMHMENGKGTVALEVKTCKVTDSGTYAVSIFNESGEAVIEIPVKIVDKPPPPSGEIAFSDVIADSVTLSWNPPIDENACVDDYIIEAKDASGRWKPVARVPGDKTQHKVTGLKEGTPYTFRVKSANEEGYSDPLESKEVTPVALDVPPQIDPKVIEELERNPIFVKAGETATIRVPCTGNCPASSSWKHNGEEILPVKHHRATKMSSMNDVVLKITKCQASDSGVYEARIFNDVGGVSLKANIVVLDVPDFSNANLRFDKVTPKEVSMTWDAPAQDGGSPVDSYVIERAFSGSDKFEKIGETKSGSTSFKCTNCEAGVEYVFRVKAVNKQGQSEAAVSKPITCGIAVVPPSVSAETIKALTQKPMKVKAGQTCRMKVPYSGGQPPPTITWEKDGEPLKDEGTRVKGSSDAKNAQACIHKCSGQDSGRYVCKLKNEAGEIVIPIDLQVLDMPSKITSPIDFSEVSSKGVTIDWKAVDNDGGSKVTHYVIEKKEEGRKVWSSVGKTKGAMTSFRAGVPAGKTYKFRVKAVTEVGEGEAKESEAVTVKDPFDAPSAMTGDIELVESTNDSITISWDKVANDGGSPLKGYYVEKRKKGTSTWSRCNPDNPCRDQQYKATNLRQEQEYEFRVIAVNAAGEGDPSRASRPITAAVPVAPPGEPSDLEMIDSTNSSLTFSWKGTDHQGGAELLGYDIELKKEGSEEWIKYNETYITGNQYMVRGLEHGCNYHVRMRSRNVGSYSAYYRYKGLFTAEEMHVIPGFKMTSELEIMVREGFVINAGGTIRIYIPYHGRPKPEINWMKDGSELDDTVNVHDVDGVSQLIIRNARGIHSGSYKVTLKNASGTQSLCIKIRVSDVPCAPSGPLEVITTNENITIKWRHSKSGINGDFLGYTIQKREARGRDWQTLVQNLKSTEYTITDLHKQRSYYLRVQAENSIGKSEPLQTKDMVFIKQAVAKVHIEDMQYDEKDLRKAPLVTVPLRPRNVPDGVKVTLSCSISGKPYPNTRWFKDNRDITDDSYYFKENVIGLCRLVIANVKVGDAGLYKVVAENVIGTATSEASLNVSN